MKCLHVLVAHSLAVGPGVNPFGDEALELLPEWWARGRASTPTTRSRARQADPVVTGRRDRLRHQLGPPARRRRRRRPARPTCTARCGSSGSARASTGPASWRPRRSSAPALRAGRLRRDLPRARGRARAHGRDQRHARRRATATTSRDDGARRPRRASRRSSAATRRRRCPSTARPAGSTRRDGPVPRHRHRRRLHRAGPRARRAPRRRCRSTSAASG